MQPTVTVRKLPSTVEVDELLERIKKNGTVARFENTRNGFVKHVSKIEFDADGDLTADWGTGTTLFVCPHALGYFITEITHEQAAAERANPPKPGVGTGNQERNNGPAVLVRLGGDDSTY